MWCVVWGEQRTGKTSLKMQIAYAVYHDWDKVLQSFVFNLGGLLYKINKGEPERTPTLNKLHMRVPIILYDDFGGQSNKAETRYNPAWDIFKGGFDVLGTQVAVIMASMVDPAEPTFQLMQKYTHELFVPSRGVYKYDRVIWNQDYKGWRPRRSKDWIETNNFKPVPIDVYKQYDEMRLSLVDEMHQRIQDAICESRTEQILKRLLDADVKLLETIQIRGPTYYEKIMEEVGPDCKDALIRCKARSLIVPIRKESGYYKYDLTDLGYQILDAIKKGKAQPVTPTYSSQFKINSPAQQVANNLLGKKEIAESLKFQGFRVTESYDSADPDIVVWKDATTPQEVISVKVVLPPQKIIVNAECEKEIAFAQKYGFKQIHLICISSLTKQKIFDADVDLKGVIEIKNETNLEPAAPKQNLEITGTEKKHSLVLDLKLVTSPVQITDRVMAVSEAFGVGVDDKKEFTIFDNVELKYDDEDLVYVTGDSGSGKSTFLRIFKSELENNEKTCVDFSAVQVDKDEVIINSLGASQEEAMNLLSVVGLSEAFVMLRKYKELSEGQKYRYKLARMIAQDGNVFLIDEFGATLDREMARVLAYCLQKWTRRNKKMVVVATTHKDLIEDFNPNIVIDKKFGQTTQIKYYHVHPKQFSLVEMMQIEQATKEDYEYLKVFHYLRGNPAAVKNRFKLTYKGETIGIIVYTLSFRALRYRNQLFPEYKNNIQKVNSEILRISRVIIHPKFRGIGLAQVLVKQTLPQVNARVVECVAAMAKYNPFFEKAGMTLAGLMELQREQKKLLSFIEGAGGKISLLHNKALCKAFLNNLSSVQLSQLQKILEKNINGMGGSSPGRMKKLQKNLSEGNFSETLMNLLPVQRCYLYWVNPNLT
jgi:ABC-type lipoprotein export system ATPase subunit/GNAT superfamily N-acetyltransferase